MKPVTAHFLIGLLFCSAALAQDGTGEELLVLPSGLEVELQEALLDGAVHRFRFVAPEFAGVSDAFEVVRGDLEYLCKTYAVPQLAEDGVVPEQVIISLADQPSEFGVVDPDVIQVFEAYRLKDDTCIWEAF